MKKAQLARALLTEALATPKQTLTVGFSGPCGEANAKGVRWSLYRERKRTPEFLIFQFKLEARGGDWYLTIEPEPTMEVKL